MNKLPLLLMLFVLVAPFAASIALLDDKEKVADKARGEWLSQTYHVSPPENNNWQILWREQDCQGDCNQWENVLLRARMALGKNQDKVDVNATQLSPLKDMKNGLFIANQKGLVLLSYDANEKGAYNLFKDLRVLLKHNG